MNFPISRLGIQIVNHYGAICMNIVCEVNIAPIDHDRLDWYLKILILLDVWWWFSCGLLAREWKFAWLEFVVFFAIQLSPSAVYGLFYLVNYQLMMIAYMIELSYIYISNAIMRNPIFEVSYLTMFAEMLLNRWLAVEIRARFYVGILETNWVETILKDGEICFWKPERSNSFINWRRQRVFSIAITQSKWNFVCFWGYFYVWFSREGRT